MNSKSNKVITGIVLVFCVGFWVSPLHAQPKRPNLPNLGDESGRGLVQLARTAMLEFLHHRTKLEDQPIPKQLQAHRITIAGKKVPLGNQPYPVCLRLWKNGKRLARVIKSGDGLYRNIILAALQAMRSPQLGATVNEAILTGLTIDLEILGRPVNLPQRWYAGAVDSDHMARIMEPGLQGIRFAVGMRDEELGKLTMTQAYQESLVLPSMAYRFGWDRQKAWQSCMSGVRLDASNAELKRQWSIFSAAQYVDIPKQGTYFLYRGKQLLTPQQRQAPDGVMLARLMGACLVRNQQKGQFVLVDRQEEPIADQLYAAYVLTQLARATKDAAFRNAAAETVLYVTRNFVKVEKTDTLAHVETVRPNDQILATAMYILAAGNLPQGAKSQKVISMMTAFLRKQLNASYQFTDTKGQTVDLHSTAAAVLALFARGAKRNDPTLLKALEVGCSKLQLAAGVWGRAWAGRVMLLADAKTSRVIQTNRLNYAAELMNFQITKPRLDQRGALRCLPDTTAGTAMATTYWLTLRRKNQVTPLGLSAERRSQLSATIRGGLAFCSQMMYRLPETYCVDDPIRRVGAVRRRPEYASPSLRATAATIEAMLRQQFGTTKK